MATVPAFEVDVREPTGERPGQTVDGADFVLDAVLERKHVLAVDRDGIVGAEVKDLYLLLLIGEVHVAVSLDGHHRCPFTAGGLLQEARDTALRRGRTGEREVPGERHHRTRFRNDAPVDGDIEQILVLQLKLFVAVGRAVFGREL